MNFVIDALRIKMDKLFKKKILKTTIYKYLIRLNKLGKGIIEKWSSTVKSMTHWPRPSKVASSKAILTFPMDMIYDS